MTRSAMRGLTGLAMLVVGVAGCGGSGPDGVPAGSGPVSLADLTGVPSGTSGARRVTMILPPEPNPQHLLWDESARREAATKGVVYSGKAPTGGESQADLIRRLSREGRSALIVVPVGPEDLAPVLAEARDRGAAVLTLLNPVPIEGKAVPAVVRGPLEPAAKELVAAVIADAPLIEKSADGPAAIVYVPEFPEAELRAKALLEAAREAGLSLIGDGPIPIPFEVEEARAAIRQVRAEHPDLAMVLVADDPSLSGAIGVRNEGTEEERFVIAGFVVNATQFDFVRANFVSAAAFADDQVLGLFAVRNALELLAGGEVPDRIVTPLPTRRAPGPPAPIPADFDPEMELPSGAGEPSRAAPERE